MSVNEFDAASEVAALKKETQLLRKRRYKRRSSVIDPYKQHVIKLYELAATNTEIQRYLKRKGVNVSLSTVTRYMKHLKDYG